MKYLKLMYYNICFHKFEEKSFILLGWVIIKWQNAGKLFCNAFNFSISGNTSNNLQLITVLKKEGTA